MNRCAHCYGDLPDFAVFCPHCAHADEPDFQQLIHHTVGDRYRLYRHLGQGGLSTVFAATDLQTDSVVVVKVSDPAQLVQRELSYAIDAEAARNYWSEMLERMRREAETLARIDHPNIVRFYDTGLIGEDLRFVVMEFLRGRMLRDELDAKGRLESADAIHIALEICEALREVHARDIIHRDISPRNIFIADCGLRIADPEFSKSRLNLNYQQQPTPNDFHQSAIRNPHSEKAAIKLIDFGIAKFPQPPGAPPFTQHSVLSGTVAYASPEQCQSREVDHRSDIYSLGVVLYEMVTGQRPFTGRTPTEIALKQIQAEPIPPRQLNPQLPGSLERAILRALAKNPDERQQSAGLLAEELRASARQIVIPLQSVQSPELGASEGELNENSLEADENEEIDRIRLVRRRRRRVALAAAALILVAAATGMLFGKNWLASHLPGFPMADSAALDAAPSPTPGDGAGALSSDPDSLELAAQLPADAIAAAARNSGAQASPTASPANLPNEKAAVSITAKSASNIAAKPSPSPKPVIPPPTTQVATRTQSTATATPPPVIARPPQPSNPPAANKPEIAQAPHRRDENSDSRQGSGNPGRDSARDSARESANREPAPSARRDRIASNRDRDEGNYRRDPNSRRTDSGVHSGADADDDAPDSEDSRQVGPKLIQWSGSVNREREITIDLPGVPGTLEIPRVYRNRVGMIEPPSGSNRWRCAKLRVFGQGGVSFVVRWWPRVGNFVRLSAQK